MTASIPEAPISDARAWCGADIQQRDDWIHRFNAEQIAELEAAARRVKQEGIPLTELRQANFSLPSIRDWTMSAARELELGRGFLLLRGLPVERWGLDLAQYAYVGLGLQLGALASQNAAGDLLGHVRDTGENPNDPAVRRYKTRLEQPFHTDGADVIGLLCLQTAREGGQSRICSSVTLFNEILARRPDLAPLLFQPFYFDRNDEQAEGEPPAFPMPLCYFDGQKLRTFYVSWYIRDAQRHAEVPRLTASQIELLDLIDVCAADPNNYLSMDFQPGDIQLLKNCYILHCRTHYTDWSDPEKKRHLLRLWINAQPLDAIVQELPTREGAVSDSDLL
ncbi:MAG: TauD/TfdA family dioxygenase [Pseudomonadales bacterium]